MTTLDCPANEDGNENNELDQLTKHPKTWFKKRFPELYKKYNGEVVFLVAKKDGARLVQNFNEDFIAETLGINGNPTSPTIYVSREGRFYRYEQSEGIYMPVSESILVTEVSSLLQQCAEDCEDKGCLDTGLLRFHLSKSSQLNGVIKKAKGYLNVSDNYFDTNVQEYIACKNGMLRLSDMQLVKFDPSFRRRNKLSVAYDPYAKCPLFENTLMRQSLDEDDIRFLQEWFGVALLGKNIPQVIVILFGTAGGGKSTFANIVAAIIGRRNVYTLRTEKLGDKFETSFYLGKTLLQGVDVATDFLTHKSASALKSLTGGDIMNVEVKFCPEGGPEIEGYFNVIIICNTLPNIRLEGDLGAWKRRFGFVHYCKTKPQTVIASLADLILKEEGSGVLNWALAGLMRIRDNKWGFILTKKQNDLVDKALLQSASPQVFVKNCLEKHDTGVLSLNDCFEKYHHYCMNRDWEPLPYGDAMPIIKNQILRIFALAERHDLRIPNVTSQQRGWKGIKVK